MDRYNSKEAATYLRCSESKLSKMATAGLLDGTFYEIGTGIRNRRRLYIKDRLDEWILAGGEPTARERKLQAETMRASPGQIR